jgi:hypothetical protein
MQQPIDWSETYDYQNKQPFSTSVLLELAEGYFPDNHFLFIQDNIYRTFDTLSTTSHKNYFFTGDAFFMQDSTLQKFLHFISAGNDAFIAAKNFSSEVAEELFGFDYSLYTGDSLFDTYYDTVSTNTTVTDNFLVQLTDIIDYVSTPNVNVNFIDTAFASINGYNYFFKVQEVLQNYYWPYFMECFIQKDLKTYTVKPLGKIGPDAYNFIEIQHGEGSIFLFTTPILLTNFYLIEKENLEYTSKLLSHLSPGDIIWDEYSKYPHSVKQKMKSNPTYEPGPLQFILTQRTLRWAWYILLTGTILFILFRGKRRQQAIPIAEPNINKSLEFVQTIGRMYYMGNNKTKLIDQKMKLFMHYVKERYRIQTLETGAVLVSKIAMHAQVPESDVNHIFATYQYLLKQSAIENADVMDFHKLIDTFYKTCK